MDGEFETAGSLRRHRALIVLLAAYAGVVLPTAMQYGRFPGDLRLASICPLFTLLFVLIGLLFALIGAARSDRAAPGAAILRWWRRWWRRDGPGTVVACAALPALMTVFIMAKSLIPDIQPYAWDVRLATLDRLIHGTDPWRLLQPFLGVPALSNALSLIYSLWFIMMFGAWVAWALTDHPQRMRFLLSFALCWILLGSVAATVLSSAGPVFYAEITGDPSIFGELMAYLRGVDSSMTLVSLRIRDALWDGYVTGRPGGGSGISAMPSLHVAIVTLCAISGWYVSWRAGLALTLYAGVIFLGSIHLGWHYALDGYVSMVSVAAIWWAVGWFLRRAARRTATAGCGFPAPGRPAGAPGAAG